MAGAVQREHGRSDAFGAELMQLASERLGDRAQARTVVADAIEALRRRDRSGERVGDPKAFLFQAVRRLTAERPSPSALRLAVPLLRGRPEERLARIGSEPDYQRRLRSYAGCIAKLTERNRKVLLLRRLHGLKTAQVAERTGLPPAMVEDRLASSLRRCWRAVRPPEFAQLERQDPVLLAVSWFARLEGEGLGCGRL
ncbi:MAG: sigma factor-like helix-turn-helix DNA-binding protein [Rhodovibrionaceae bacterium]